MALKTRCNARVVWGNKTAINRGVRPNLGKLLAKHEKYWCGDPTIFLGDIHVTYYISPSFSDIIKQYFAHHIYTFDYYSRRHAITV